MTNTLKIYGYRCPQDDDVMPTDLAQECQNDEGFAYTDPLVRLKDVRELVQKGGSRAAAGWQTGHAMEAGVPYWVKDRTLGVVVMGVRPYSENIAYRVIAGPREGFRKLQDVEAIKAILSPVPPASLESVSRWRPIGSAPKKGRGRAPRIFLHVGGLHTVGFWDQDLEDWVSEGGGFVKLEIGTPTHWMPLHENPTT